MKEYVIPDFPEYKINENGEVFSKYKFKTSIVTNDWRPVKQVLDKKIGYYLVTLVNAKTKVKIIYPIHGVFEKTPSSHLTGNGCKLCALDKTGWTTKNVLKIDVKN